MSAGNDDIVADDGRHPMPACNETKRHPGPNARWRVQCDPVGGNRQRSGAERDELCGATLSSVNAVGEDEIGAK